MLTAVIFREPMTRFDARLSAQRAFSFAEMRELAIQAGWKNFGRKKFRFARQAVWLAVDRQSLRCEGGDDFFKTRIAAQGIPPRHQFQFAIAKRAGVANCDAKLFAGEIFVPQPGSDHRQVPRS